MSAEVIPFPRERAGESMDVKAVCARIKAALQRRSGKAWSVTHGRGTSYGWITIDAPPARRTWHSYYTGFIGRDGSEIWLEEDTGQVNGHMGPEDRETLRALLDVERMHDQGESIPSSRDHYREYLDRAEGRTPSKIAVPYWD